ncbi:MAG TPA: dihydroorotase [Candidatus Acidoferrales bacterium]
MLLIKGGRVIDPASKLDDGRDILIADGRISAIEKKIEKVGAEIFDASGMVVAPGFLDLHVHLREPGGEGAESIATGTRAAAAGGFTAVCSMPNTQPVNDNAAVTASILSRARETGVVTVYPVGAASSGSAGEELSSIAAMKRAGIVAVSDDGRPIANARLMRGVMEYCRTLGLPVIDHCEEPSLFGEGVMHEGAHSTRLGLRGIPAACEEIPVARNCILARETGAHIHLAHLSTCGALESVRLAKQRGVRVTCEVTPHHFTLMDEDIRDYRTCYKMNPPLRGREDRDALVEGIADGTVDAIATDHAPHHPVAKEVEFDLAPFGVIGLETALGLALDRLVHTGKISLTRLVELFSTHPAKILGLDRGKIQVAATADLTLFDPAREWTYRVEQSESKSRNSPFDGWKFRGAPMATIVAGKIIYQRK